MNTGNETDSGFVNRLSEHFQSPGISEHLHSSSFRGCRGFIAAEPGIGLAWLRNRFRVPRFARPRNDEEDMSPQAGH